MSALSLFRISSIFITLSPSMSFFPLYPIILLLFGCPLVFYSLSHQLNFLSLFHTVCHFCTINEPLFHWYKKKKIQAQLRHQSMQWPSFRLEPYLKLKLSPPKMQWLPFFVFVNNSVTVQCDAIWNGLSSLLLSLSPPSKRKYPTCNGVKIGLGALSEKRPESFIARKSPSPISFRFIRTF